MVYLEGRKKAGKTYYYAKESYRVNGTVKTRTIAYLGTDESKAKKHLSSLSTLPQVLTEKEVERVTDLYATFSQFKKSIDKASWEHILNDFIILFTNETNRIEGSTFTVKETRMLLEDNITPEGKNLREVYEQVNTKKLFEAHAAKPFRITEKDLIRIHEIFVQNIDTRTGYRTRPVRILGSTTKTTPPEHIAMDIRLLLSWHTRNAKTLPPIVLAALFHAKFEQIHPFADGNGRTGRFITYVMLEKSMPTLFPNRKNYLDALEASQNKALDSSERRDYDAIITYFLRAQEHTWKNFFAER
jgi:Fic family protein